jgi:nucleotide-binding universal stress UspA family protein
MTRVLVPIAVLKGETVSPGLMNLLGTVDVTVLGYHVLPDQTPPDQARLQYEDRATSALEDLSEEFRTAGGAADHRLVFTHDREQTINRIANEIEARALAISGVTGDVDQILVPLSGDVAVERILSFVEDLVGDRDIGVTLFLAAENEEAATERLDTAAEHLRSSGLSVQTMTVVGSPFEALIDEVPGHDVIVMGERAPSFRSLVFGEESERVAEESVGPVLVVRYDEALDE